MNEFNPKKILVIRFSSLGDVVLTTAIFPNLKAQWPQAEITVLTKNAYSPVFNNNPSVDSVLVFNSEKQSFSDLAKEIREARFDLIIDLQNNLRSWFIRLISGPPMVVSVKKKTIQRWLLVNFKWKSSSLERSVRERILYCLKPLEIPASHSETQLFADHAEKTLQTLSIPKNTQLIAIAPGAKHNTKRWMPSQFAEAANRLGAIPNSLILILGDKTDRKVADEVASQITVPHKNLVGWTNIQELTNIISSLSFLLTNDSGIFHMAEALHIPLVVLYGPTVRSFGFSPYRETSRVVEVVNLHCRPCSFHGDEKCPLKHHKCMQDIDINAVLFAASSVLKPLHENSPAFNS